MDAERWARIKSVFYAAAERAADERVAFIRSECDGDQTLASEVESLLATPDRGDPRNPGLAGPLPRAGREVGSRALDRPPQHKLANISSPT